MEPDRSFGGATHAERILIVDSDPAARHAVRQGLLRDGFDVIEATNGSEGLERALRETPSIIVLELVLPRMSGLEVCRRLKSGITTEQIPIIALTQRIRVEDKLRAIEAGADDYIPKPFDVREVCARIGGIIRRSKRDRGASPLTGLPGNVVLEQEIADRVTQPGQLAVIHLDLNSFKPYNDYYSYKRGDQVLRLTAQLIVEAARGGGGGDTFVAHLGGDDFFVVTSPERADAIANRAVQAFDALIPLHYDDEDRQAGYITAANRRGIRQNYPLMSIAACIATNEAPNINHPGQIAQTLTELKTVAKGAGGSKVVRDRRGSVRKGTGERGANSSADETPEAPDGSEPPGPQDAVTTEGEALSRWPTGS